MGRDGDRGGSYKGEQGFLFIDIPERPAVADFAKVYFHALICAKIQWAREREGVKNVRLILRQQPVASLACVDAAKYTTMTIA